MRLTCAALITAFSALLVGCSGDGTTPVSIDSPDVDAKTTRACHDFLDALPEKLSGESRVEVEPSDALGMAWGDPAIVVTCGVGVPEEFTRFSACWEANGVGWFSPDDQVEDPTADITLTTIGWTPGVEIRLPGELRPPDGVVVPIGTAVKQNLEHTGKPCV